LKSGTSIALPASLTGGAAILSVITGFISGVSTGTILIRGAATAVITFGFIFGCTWLIRTFLPELTEEGERSEDNPLQKEGNVEASGQNINIVMPAETPGSVQGIPPQQDIPGEPVDNGLSHPVDQMDNKIAESGENVHNNKPEVSEIDTSGFSDGNNLDVLPSLDTLDLNTGAVSSNEDEDLTEEPAAAAAPVSDNGFNASNDPAEIAKAVKTVLKRDQQE
jgi:hypothetical protein